MSENENENETYRITLKGLLYGHLSKKYADDVYNAIELSCRRNNWGIAIDQDNTLDFVQMKKVEESK
jgi:hypothetical protein